MISDNIDTALDNAKATANTNTHNSTTEVSNTRAALKPPNEDTKVFRVIVGLTRRSYNRFEAASHLHDHCLHSTVSIIQRYGIRVDRKTEVVRGFMGNPTAVSRYWIDEIEAQKALKFLRGS